MASAGSGEKRVGRTRAQAADVPLDEAGAEADDEEEPDEEDEDALAFVSEPDDEDDAESDDFEAVDAGVLLDDEPRLSFR
ncbi:hypothetical protein YW3DRAFT_04137 [Streptomyces sp. MnatMP-M77]|nr:hypothetical protein SACT1_4584 [Streptomyces sp. ACT-1]SBV08137.1 hypothetical protein YW3DRAFT_04137 [Streptomyces sp. MnatMP-M77]SCE46654.1 hypothetical protein GA0115261_105782 [Streptomyces sp. OspMP-M43]SEE70663.1 hypothetical protein SAMN04490359_5208 [Streptomyces griseus]SQA27016.1 Uncharacterised protein [Streptomyces griseus]